MTNKVEDFYLRPWEEAVGICFSASVTETETTLVLQVGRKQYRLHLSRFQTEPYTLKQQRIAVFKTEIPKKPFFIRILDAASKETELKTTTTEHGS